MSEFVLIDWGTSSFRLWQMDQDSKTLCKHRSQHGMSRLSAEEYEPLLEITLSNLSIGSHVPVLICGMAGAAQGWQDAGYIDTPADLQTIIANVIEVDTKNGRDVRILPGIAQRNSDNPDVMRGEETLLFGARQAGLDHTIYCLPGTHSKWVFMHQGEISHFKTFMTGELFALLSQQSTLSHFLKDGDEFELETDVFKETISHTLDNPSTLVQSLFSMRSGPLVGRQISTAALHAKLSGLLIGSEIAAMKDQADNMVGLIADDVHAETYSLAFRIAGIEYEQLDSESLVLTGLSHVAQEIWRGDAS